ncbi:MAG: SUMF1/EgtB/PvdO family nonheme iron enzyme [Planctomycetes bacterium]|nr:SUMF1/EgtB/PvdO family nonheme iron enzyme [Planctomycetota bacterium]
MRNIFSALLLAGLFATHAAGQAPGASDGRPRPVGSPTGDPAVEGVRQGGQAASAGGVDGVKNGNFGFHTGREDKPWWQVDLEKVQALDRVVVWNRCNTASERAASLRVLLSSDGNAWRQAYQHDGTTFYGVKDQIPLTVPLQGAEARFVRIQLAENTWLHLDEVEVFGRADPKVNIALRKPADQSSGYGGPGAAAAPASAPAKGKAARKQDAAGGWPVGAPTEANRQALRRATDDLVAGYPDTYVRGAEFLRRLDALDTAAASGGDEAALAREFLRLQREALLANPALDFDRLLLVKRKANSLGLPANWQSNSNLPRSGFDNEIGVLSVAHQSGDPDGAIATLYKPDKGRFVGDVDLHFDADRLLFSSLDEKNRWQVFEIKADGSGLRQVTPGDPPDVDNYDACYLPDGRIIFTSTAPFIGVPCVFGGSHVSTIFRLEADGKTVRQLGFEQEHDWCPAVLNDGRLLYARWEYTDTPHSQARRLFSMNPDGTRQMAYYGTNSYWPNSIFYARPVPGHPTKVAAVVSGHHGVPRMGELILFDPGLDSSEARGVVQRIPGYGKPVEPLIADRLVDASWPKFLHPYPLNEKYFLAACRPGPSALWGIYLVDVFDNILLLREEPGYALLEPVPLRKTVRPPALPDNVMLARKDAVIFIQDIYQGDGLKGIPRGTVKKLRVFTYHFAYHNMGGLLGVLGMDGPWDIRRILGTVPVAEDGSACFRVPANTPISVQPLDAEGKALQLMRSWMTAMPGETLTCVGCHERPNSAPDPRMQVAQAREPAEIEPWYGPARGFSYPREVQPVLDRYCVGCHDGEPRPDGKALASLSGTKIISDFASVIAGSGGKRGGRFSYSYAELHRYVRRPGIESDIRMLTPMEYHADTTELVQMLKKGHYGVQLDPESWDRLITWIDFNTVYHGTWTDAGYDPGVQRERRLTLQKLYGNRDDDPEAEAGRPPAVIQAASCPVPARTPEAAKAPPPFLSVPGWPFDAAEAQRRQAAAGPMARRSIDLGGGAVLDLVLVPAGEFVLGDPEGSPDERPLTRARIDRPFWMGRCEVSNAQFARFDPSHDSRVESKNAYQFGIHGYPVNRPEQPVVRVSWQQATAFCRWLSATTGETFSLPTEAQWEYACRAGSATAFSYGTLETDFSKSANLGDAKLRELASNPYTVDTPYPNATKYDDWVPKDARFSDGSLLSAAVGRYAANAWGLHDMHGNVAEWTRSAFRPYPYREDDGRNSPADAGDKVVRGGSWRDRPMRCGSAFRLAYRPYQAVFNVGFRIVGEAAGTARLVAGKTGE